MAADLRRVQAALLEQKASVMKSLGLDELDHKYDTALSAAAKAGRKRKAAAAQAAAIDPEGPRRRSMR